MSGLDLRTIARALGGEVTGRQVLAPGPNHSRNDRSLSVRLSAQSPTGFIVFSHAGDDFRDARDFVSVKLGVPLDAWRTRGQGVPRPTPTFTPREPEPESDNSARTDRARALWDQSRDAHGTVAEVYLKSRGLELPEGSDVLRFNPSTPWKEDDGSLIYTGCMISLLRNIVTDEIQCVQRTRISPSGAKLGRKMTGPAGGAAIKVDDHASVEQGVVVGEGLETVLTGRLYGLRPAWALGSAASIAAFPLLPGIDGITILGEAGDANAKAVEACASRWHASGREVVLVEPTIGSDINDALRGVA